jgi:hypothetical protein
MNAYGVVERETNGSFTEFGASQTHSPVIEMHGRVNAGHRKEICRNCFLDQKNAKKFMKGVFAKLGRTHIVKNDR